MAFNKVILMGNMVADPELKTTSSGVYVTSFRIAVKRKYNDDVDFIDIVCWKQTAEFVCKHFTKGKGILVCGSLQTRSWTTQDGQKRYTTEVVADEVTFAGGKGEDKPAAQYKASDNYEEIADDEDLPF